MFINSPLRPATLTERVRHSAK